MKIQQGDFVEARGRPWLVEAVDDLEPGLTTIRLSFRKFAEGSKPCPWVAFAKDPNWGNSSDWDVTPLCAA
jgi:hypothetical protein